MNKAKTIRHAGARLVLGAMGVLWTCTGSAFAQTEQGTFDTVGGDAYGNARPWYPERRTVGGFANEAQFQATRGYQLEGRRENRRGAGVPFGLSANPFADTYARRVRNASRREVGPYTTRQAFSRYGGFGRRFRDPQADDISAAFARRYVLLKATSRIAPVQRALIGHTPWPAPPTLLGRATVEAPDTGGGPPAGGPKLADELRQDVSRSYHNVRDEGWEWFREGSYRRSARAFESAALVNPADMEARLGELFCHVSLGAMRTAMALLGPLERRDPNPFAHDLNLTDFYATPVQAREVRVQCQLFAQANTGVIEAAALYSLVLWYLGDKDEAMLVARSFPPNYQGTVYADWPPLMEAVARLDEQP